MMAAPTSDELIIQQIRETCHSLFNEAKLKSSNYCNAYRHTALMKFLPVILAQRNFSPSSREFLFGVIPELVKFFLSAVFEWNSEQGTSVVVPIDSAWVSLFQTVRRIFDVCCEDNKIPKPPEFWSVWKTSVPCLKVWWKQLIQWNTIVRQSTNLPSTILFWLKFIFAGFLIYIYDQIKLECGLPERRPFLFEIPNIYGASKTSSRQSTSHIDRTVSRLQQIFLLAENVWTTLIREQQMYPDSIMDTTIAELDLHDSPMFLSFQSDFWTFHQLPGFIPPHDIHPSWLTIQLLSRNVSLKLSTGQLTPSILEEVLNLTAKFQLRNGWSRTTSKDFDEERGLRYICDDSEILVFFCSVCTVHMARQPVERCSDEFLSTLLVFMQPVIDKCTDLLRAVAAALIMRQKFVFKQFFTYICSPEIIAGTILCFPEAKNVIVILNNLIRHRCFIFFSVEISGLLGKVGLELTPEPLTSTAGSVHNTRGAIRGSTDVLQTELQKLAINAISNSDVILAVQRYMGDNKETLSVVMFQQQQQPAISPPRRGRSGNIIS